MRNAAPLLVVLGAVGLNDCTTQQKGGPLAVEECPIGCVARVGQYPRSAFEGGEELVRGELGGVKFGIDGSIVSPLPLPVLLVRIDFEPGFFHFEQLLDPDTLDDLGIEIVPSRSGDTLTVKLQEDLTVQGLLQRVTEHEPPQNPSLENAIRSAVCALAPLGGLRREFPTTARLVIQTPTGSGSGAFVGTAELFSALPARWRALDVDGDGLEEAVPLFIDPVISLSRSSFFFSLQAVIPNLGPVGLKHADPSRHSFGPPQVVIQETTNHQQEILEKPVEVTLKNVFVELTIGGRTLHNHDPLDFHVVASASPDSVINPPRLVSFLASGIELLDDAEQPTGVKIRAATSQSGCGVARLEYVGGTTVQRLLAVLIVWLPFGIVFPLRRRGRRRLRLS